ncbi:hypothetical protein Glove_384g14 [Diversispora epigaea]|uniref:Helitron helicase-like domain-containing protein n=1 Tax=Diversispora epigaea TaxID=1348612 RepID=A0A397HBC3_9GLOM|nr:hypothetical protein Glove_384g14 [Diversispora epigaea]
MLFHRADNYDTFVSAELSDPVEQLRLYQTVVSVMIHGPYGPFNNNVPSQTDKEKCFWSHIYVAEFEKCDLPHAHMLFHRADNYDTFVSAELSDPVEQLRLYQTVVSVMIHGPYGPFNNNVPCMRENLYIQKNLFKKQKKRK